MSDLISAIHRCLLCRGKNLTHYKSVQSDILPASKKNIQNALLYLARCNKIDIQLTEGEMICMKCFDILSDYDTVLMETLRKQRKLIQLIERAVEDSYSDIEDECIAHMATMDEINDNTYFDGHLDSVEEIERTVEAICVEECGVQKRPRQEHKDADEEQSAPPSKIRFFEQTLQCPLCSVRFISKTRLQKHILSTHKKFKCEICEFSHRNKDYVKLHMNTHEGRSDTSCLYCQKDFSSKISTIRHMEAHIDEKKYQCDKCGLCFSQTTILNNHRMQHEAEEQPLQCDICRQLFKTKRTYRHHMVTHRPDRPRYCCEFCNKTFTEKYTLKVHRRMHPEAAVTMGTITTIDADQQQHQLIPTPEVGSTVQIHSSDFDSAPLTEMSKFLCIICDQDFDSKEQMNKHMEKEHDVILKPLSHANLNNYEVLNSESKKACNICGQMFGTQLNLEYHIRDVHIN